MTNPTLPNTSPERLWHADNLRLTAFPSPATQFNATGQWAQIVGQAPDSQTIQTSKSIIEEIGKFANGRLQLLAQPVRIDWNYGLGGLMDQDPPPTNSELPFTVALRSFLQVAERWLPVGPSLRRLAFGAILTRPVQSRIEGYREMAHYLENVVRLDPEGSSDFLYQINRPRQLTDEPRIKINRLSKWSVGQVQFTQVAVNPGIRPYITLGDPILSMRLELDINTDADYHGDLPQMHLADLFRRLTNEGMEIAEQGDVP